MTYKSLNKIEISVPTSALAKLLADNPEITLHLQSMACEKIAEEIHKKALKINMSQQQQVFDAAIRNATSKLTSKYLFPKEAQEAIEWAVSAHMLGGFAKELVNAKTDLHAFITKEIDRQFGLLRNAFAVTISEGVDNIEAKIRKIARDEFLLILKETKGEIS